MFNRKNKIEVVETDSVDLGEKVYATKKTVIIASLIPLAVATPILINRFTRDTYTATNIPVTAPSTIATIPPPVQIPSMPVSQITQQMPPVIAEPTGILADKSLEVLANVLDPLIEIMITLSFPIASVIIMGSCFYFMFGNSEKAWDGIMKAALGYILINLSPLFLKILRDVGESVIPA